VRLEKKTSRPTLLHLGRHLLSVEMKVFLQLLFVLCQVTTAAHPIDITSLASLRDTQPAPTVNTASLFFFFVEIRAEEALGRCGCACAAPCLVSHQGPALTWKRRSRSHGPERKGREVEPSETRARSWFQTRQRASQRELYGLACLTGQHWASDGPATGQRWASCASAGHVGGRQLRRRDRRLL
jgi:hypothetical protein